MKPIILNMSEISDSREVYDSKPNHLFAIFIYTILLIIVLAITWAYFGKIDIVVKSEAIIRPNSQISTVVNTVGGNLDTVNIDDGDQVREGDVLYIINHDDVDTELNFYEEKKNTIENNIALLNKYKASIENEENLLSCEGEEEEYYHKFITYMIQVESLKHNATYSEDERLINLTSVKEQITDYESELTYLERLKQSVKQGKNQFNQTSEELSYYNQFEKYLYDYESLKTSYETEEQEIELSTNEDSVVNSYNYYKDMRKQLKKLKSSINKGKSVFEEENIYSSQYEQYCNKIEELQSAYDQANANYETYEALAGLSVTDWEVETAYNDMVTAERNLKNYKLSFAESVETNLNETETKLQELKLQKSGTLSKEELLQQNEEKCSAALAAYQTNYMVELDTKIDSIEANLDTLYSNKESLELKADETLYIDDEEASLLSYQNSELQSITENIRTLNSQLDEVQASIDSLLSQQEDCIVKAQMTGVVNSYVELVKGDYLSSGTQVLSILPEESSMYKAYIYVSNEDIGKLEVGMDVKFNVYAYPNTDYGYLTGEITKISEDLKVDSSSSTSYYLVEAALDSVEMIDENGDSVQLKSGMACNAKIITERESILKYLLDKLNLWIFE